MDFAYLGVTLLGALGVFVTYRPLRREPWNVVSFVVGWLTGELAVQNVVWQVAATALFVAFGALSGWPGWVGLGIAVLSWIGLLGLCVEGFFSARAVSQALDEVIGGDAGAGRVPPRPTWARIWRLAPGFPIKGRSIEVIKDVDYFGDGISRHRLDVIRATGTERSGGVLSPAGRPVVVYIHGGAWLIGDKREQGKPMMYELAARGWVCVSINYRLSPSATWPDHIVDCLRAVGWVKENISQYGGDPSFVAVSGGSAGGHLCALAALSAGDPRWQPGFESVDTSVDACVPFYGVMDMTNGEGGGTDEYGPGLRRLLEARVMKTTSADNPQLFRDASPTSRVHRDAPPFFVLHGRNDTLVPVQIARNFVATLRATSVQMVAYAELPLAQHAFDVLLSPRSRATTLGAVEFLEWVRRRPPDLGK
jgi:acetyl esterase/lipase